MLLTPAVLGECRFIYEGIADHEHQSTADDQPNGTHTLEADNAIPAKSSVQIKVQMTTTNEDCVEAAAGRHRE